MSDRLGDQAALLDVQKVLTMQARVPRNAAPKVTRLTIDGSSGMVLVVDTSVLVVDATNNRVGIGTASPSVSLHIVDDGSPVPTLRVENTAFSGVLKWTDLYHSSGGDFYIVNNRTDASVGGINFCTGGSTTAKVSISYAGILTANQGITIADGKNIVLGTTTGTKIGTAAAQKLGFWNATPVVQRSHITDATDAATVITRANAIILALEQVGILAAS